LEAAAEWHLEESGCRRRNLGTGRTLPMILSVSALCISGYWTNRWRAIAEFVGTEHVGVRRGGRKANKLVRLLVGSGEVCVIHLWRKLKTVADKFRLLISFYASHGFSFNNLCQIITLEKSCRVFFGWRCGGMGNVSTVRRAWAAY
jgi:hypothetical protein